MFIVTMKLYCLAPAPRRKHFKIRKYTLNSLKLLLSYEMMVLGMSDYLFPNALKKKSLQTNFINEDEYWSIENAMFQWRHPRWDQYNVSNNYPNIRVWEAYRRSVHGEYVNSKTTKFSQIKFMCNNLSIVVNVYT